MPYRRLPNTDISRINSLKDALNKGREVGPINLAYSQSLMTKIREQLPRFENEVSFQKDQIEIKNKKSKDYHQAAKKARMYISHFLHVVNMAIQRGEINPNIREFYGIDKDDKNLPDLSKDSCLIEWGQKIIDGEQKRMQQGFRPVTNPTIALVRVRFDQFIEQYNYNETSKLSNTRIHTSIVETRKEIDTLICSLWNDIEATYQNSPPSVKRAKAAEYGVVYVFRKNELEKINAESQQLDIF